MIEMNYLRELAAEIGISLSDGQLKQFAMFYERLIATNRVMNLTAITDFDEVCVKHFLDSLTLYLVRDRIGIFGNAALSGMDAADELEPAGRINAVRLIDVGTGAGFPGVPLAIAFPHLDVTLLDSLKKRVDFLNGAVDEIFSEQTVTGKNGADAAAAKRVHSENRILRDSGATDPSSTRKIRAVHFRAEDAGQNEAYREQFDLCVSRAVSHIATLAEYCLPFVKVGGYFVAYKSGADEIREEMKAGEKAIKTLGGTLNEVYEFTLPASRAGNEAMQKGNSYVSKIEKKDEEKIRRTLVIIEKTAETPKKYPRKAGMPAKKPIL